MKILKALWRSIMPTAEEGRCDTPSQHVVCPKCDTAYKNQTEFEQEHSAFDESASALEMSYTCGRCTTESLWFVGTKVPVFLRILSYGTTLLQLRTDIHEHFRHWMEQPYTQNNLLLCATTALRINTDTLLSEYEWNQQDCASSYKTGCAVDYVLYALLLASPHEITRDISERFSVHSPCTEIETYISDQYDTSQPQHYQNLLQAAAKHVAYLESSCISAQNVPYIFVQPAVEESANNLLMIGLQMLQLKNEQHFHQLVYERLRHFVFMSA